MQAVMHFVTLSSLTTLLYPSPVLPGCDAV